MTTLEPITEINQIKDVHEGLLSDGGILYCPTHQVNRDGELIGAVSIGGIPTLHWWLDKGKGQALQSVRAVKKSEKILKDLGYKTYQTIIPDTSTFTEEVMSKLGFTKAFEVPGSVYIKNIGE